MESTKRKQTMSVLNQLRRPAARYRDEFTGEELPADEEAAQADFEKQKAARTEQGLLNKADMSAPMAEVYGAVGSGMRPGPTGSAGPGGMTPYSPEEFERRSSFSRVRKPEKKAGKKKEEEEEGTDEPVFVNAEY